MKKAILYTLGTILVLPVGLAILGVVMAGAIASAVIWLPLFCVVGGIGFGIAGLVRVFQKRLDR